MQFADNRHAADEILEQYSLGRLGGAELVEFEEHLIVCGACQDRLALEDNISQGFRDGAADFQQRRKLVWQPFPKFAWAAGLAALGLFVFAGTAWQSLRRAVLTPASILLETTRGTGNSPLAVAPAGRPLTLDLDLTAVQQSSVYKMEIVDVAGRSVLQSNGVPQNHNLQIHLMRGLAPGTYFVRVYTPGRELLREYALSVRH